MNQFSLKVQELVSSGLSESQIAESVGVSQPTINRIKLGKQVNVGYELGASLLALRPKKQARAKVFV